MGALCQLRPAITSRQNTAASATEKARSTAIITKGSATNAIATLPAIHSDNRPASGQPLIGDRPDQLGTAVRMNPAMTAAK